MENILPAHVAQHFLTSVASEVNYFLINSILLLRWRDQEESLYLSLLGPLDRRNNSTRSGTSAANVLLIKISFFQEDLYHERYSSIAVMFASIPNYKEFYDETDVNKQGLECLRLLNEIICDFDKVRTRNQTQIQ